MAEKTKKTKSNETVIMHNSKNDAAGTIALFLRDQCRNILFRVYPKMLMKNEICELELKQRAYHCLKRHGYETVGQLAEDITGIADLKKLRGSGDKTAREIMYKLYLFQYTQLAPEKQHAYLEDTIRLNNINCPGLLIF